MQNKDRRSAIQNSLAQFFDTFSANDKATKVCSHCGSNMTFVQANFFLYESDRGWQVPLAFCTSCDAGGEEFGIRPLHVA